MYTPESCVDSSKLCIFCQAVYILSRCVYSGKLCILQKIAVNTLANSLFSETSEISKNLWILKKPLNFLKISVFSGTSVFYGTFVISKELCILWKSVFFENLYFLKALYSLKRCVCIPLNIYINSLYTCSDKDLLVSFNKPPVTQDLRSQ